ncbi:hypothetical protein SAY86_025259 [Trapa natans]|uniref:DUF506 family protein n=1 Tax=Trapa natans TaxID=22666 RepID=A0AAN7RC74_TRANT|nr:hypothetical protein SAY86_025259 [Trapa natans]
MAVNVRARRVADLFGDEARARLGRQLSYASSGSDHEAEAANDDSPCLSELIHGFLEGDGCWEVAVGAQPIQSYDSDSDRVESTLNGVDDLEDAIRQALAGNTDSYGRMLLGHVVAAAEEALPCLRSDKSLFRRKVMVSLREIGYNAAICKTKWNASGGLTAGSYEFIDVIRPLPSPSDHQQEHIRYLVDLDFAGEFQIARPTEQYKKLLELLPQVFIGLGDDLKRIARAMAAAAKRSLKSRGLSLPPWKKNRYMQNKWLGPYRRTVNPSLASSLAPAVTSVNSRAVGFEEINGRLTVRTR